MVGTGCMARTRRGWWRPLRLAFTRPWEGPGAPIPGISSSSNSSRSRRRSSSSSHSRHSSRRRSSSRDPRGGSSKRPRSPSRAQSGHPNKPSLPPPWLPPPRWPPPCAPLLAALFGSRPGRRFGRRRRCPRGPTAGGGAWGWPGTVPLRRTITAARTRREEKERVGMGAEQVRAILSGKLVCHTHGKSDGTKL